MSELSPLLALFPELAYRLPDIGVREDVDRLLSHLLAAAEQGPSAATVDHPGRLHELPGRDPRTLDRLVAEDAVRAVGSVERRGDAIHVLVEHRALVAVEFVVPAGRPATYVDRVEHGVQHRVWPASDPAELYARSGRIEYLREAIERAESEPFSEDRLGILLAARFRHSGDPADLERAVALGRSALEREDDWRYRVHLAESLALQFAQTAELSLLDEALEQAEAAGRGPETVIELLLMRYHATAEHHWLQAALDRLAAALDALPPEAAAYRTLCSHAAAINMIEFDRTGDPEYVAWAVRFSHRVVVGTETSNPLWLGYGRDHALALLRSYEVTGDESQLVLAFNILAEAARRMDDRSPERPSILLGLATVGLHPTPRGGLGGMVPRLDADGRPARSIGGVSLAIDAIEDALTLLDDRGERARAYSMLATARRVRFELAAAIEDLRAAADAAELGAVEWARFVSTATVAQKLGAAERGAAVHAQGVDALLELADRDPGAAADARRRAFVLSEAGKARLLSEAVSRGELPPPPGVEPTLLAREGALLDGIRALDSAALAARDRPLSGPAGSRRREALERELHQVWDEIAGAGAQAREYVALRRGTPLSWEQIAELSHGAALVSLSVLASRTALFSVGESGQPEVGEVPLGEAGWADVLRRFDRELPRSRGRDDVPPTWLSRLRPLRAEVERLVRGADRTIVVPHREAHALPWGMLVDSAVSTVPALAVLDRARRRGASRRRSAAVLGNPTGDLPHAEAEAERVAGLLGCAPLIGPEATRAALESAAGRVSALHVAGHAAYGGDAPLDSHVKLHDGPWSAREALGARMDAELVFLSGCETALAGALAGEELAGLAQAFLHAGARALVVSLWPVHDAATARLVGEFYERRRAGAGIAGALAAASKSLREERPHPWYWAAFAAVGDCG